jgi:hypothetical protein
MAVYGSTAGIFPWPAISVAVGSGLNEGVQYQGRSVFSVGWVKWSELQKLSINGGGYSFTYSQ